MNGLIGVISDTHGLIRREAIEALTGCEIIIHAGDIGSPDVVDQLREIAPVYAVRGNVDYGDWIKPFPEKEVVRFNNTSFYVLHDIAELDIDPVTAEINAVITGHSHRPNIEQRDGVLFFNPGSAGPRRHSLPVSLGKVSVENACLRGEIIELDV